MKSNQKNPFSMQFQSSRAKILSFYYQFKLKNNKLKKIGMAIDLNVPCAIESLNTVILSSSEM